MAHASPPLSILVVEDSKDAATSTADLLTLCGHRVRVAHCGVDALREASSEMPDIVLLDIGLPDTSGWEVAKLVRQQAKEKQPIVIALTGYGTESDQWRSLDAGCDLHLVKPADPARLTALLEKIRKNLSAQQ